MNAHIVSPFSLTHALCRVAQHRAVFHYLHMNGGMERRKGEQI